MLRQNEGEKMSSTTPILLSIFTIALCMLPLACFPQKSSDRAVKGKPGDIQLLSPSLEKGHSLMESLKRRRSARNFAPHALPLDLLSSLLWAANGISSPDGRRTAPTGLNTQDTDVYVMLESGVYLYDASKNLLRLVVPGDNRKLAGRQTFSHKAPLNLFLVHDRKRCMKGSEADINQFAGIHTGAILQNVYLFCAAHDLSCVARRSFDGAALKKLLKLPEEQTVIMGETVGFPSQK